MSAAAEATWTLRLRLDCGHFVDREPDSRALRLQGRMQRCVHCETLRHVVDVLAVRDSDMASLGLAYSGGDAYGW